MHGNKGTLCMSKTVAKDQNGHCGNRLMFPEFDNKFDVTVYLLDMQCRKHKQQYINASDIVKYYSIPSIQRGSQHARVFLSSGDQDHVALYLTGSLA